MAGDNDAVLDALATAVAAAPGNQALRLHFEQFARAAGRSDLVARRVEVPRADAAPLRFSDVVGLREIKRRLRLAFLAPLAHPELRRDFGKSLHGGFLLYGPPGCGKTYIARALAGELGAHFVLVDLLGKEPDFHALFASAKSNAPTLLFFDGLEAVGAHDVAQFLRALDSVGTENEGVFVLGATNRPWDVDLALRRSGRFERMLLVLPPDADDRAAMLRHALSGKSVADDIDYAGLAQRCTKMSSADVADLCTTALTLSNGEPVSMAVLGRALAEVHPSTSAWFDDARRHTGEGSSYDDLVAYMRDISAPTSR